MKNTNTDPRAPAANPNKQTAKRDIRCSKMGILFLCVIYLFIHNLPETPHTTEEEKNMATDCDRQDHDSLLWLILFESCVSWVEVAE